MEGESISSLGYNVGRGRLPHPELFGRKQLAEIRRVDAWLRMVNRDAANASDPSGHKCVSAPGRLHEGFCCSGCFPPQSKLRSTRSLPGGKA